ncbi:Thioredoxin-like incomplete domain containing protein [Pandoravirus salinus]|uniref:Thioredoxin-like incomplete domain containing protein n=1 Tax=Pandoravirus salinus TaxID=1349410 RepID=S4W1A2_9VIRU|nr:Thioredoxin-like superfamily incomplete domain [Pandoravirus salinus]AGO84202.2 Thioredoxin-like incomplete domain containing protein [Pandoravirus salinus]
MTAPDRDAAAIMADEIDPVVEALADALAALGASMRQNAPEDARSPEAFASVARCALPPPSDDAAADSPTQSALPAISNHAAALFGSMTRHFGDQHAEMLVGALVRSAPVALEFLEGVAQVCRQQLDAASTAVDFAASVPTPIASPTAERHQSPLGKDHCDTAPERESMPSAVSSRRASGLAPTAVQARRGSIVDKRITGVERCDSITDNAPVVLPSTHRDPYAHQDRSTSSAAPSASPTATLSGISEGTLASLPAFVAALEALPVGFMISGGADGVRLVTTRSALRVSDLVAGNGACPLIMTALDDATIDVGGAWCNAIQLLGGPVCARSVARSLVKYAATHPHALVMIGEAAVALPFAPPTVDVLARSLAVSDTRLNIARLPANRQKIADAALAVGRGESLDCVLALLLGLEIDPLATIINFYRVGDRLMSEFDLTEAYPRMDLQVRDVLFCPVTPLFVEGSGDAHHSKVVLYDTPLAASILDAAYGPADECLAAARRLLLEAAVPAVAAIPAVDSTTPGAPRSDTAGTEWVSRGMDFDRGTRFCRDNGGGLVVLARTGCSDSHRVTERLDEVASRILVAVAVIDHEKIPPAHRPPAYPHIYGISHDNRVIVYDGDRSADDLVRFVGFAFGGYTLRD